ncbi:MAG: hypothetical protein F2682_03450 [Actinobacteria bacterium]|nr:hypothetical protein [Actinomycetota bacterium]
MSDLSAYTQWLDIVYRAEADNQLIGGDPVWNVQLRGKVGPFARSKNLRMVRTVNDAGSRVVFERKELDGRSHSAWVLTADISPKGDGSTVAVHLHYGGTLFTGGVLERLLADQITRGQQRLLQTL